MIGSSPKTKLVIVKAPILGVLRFFRLFGALLCFGVVGGGGVQGSFDLPGLRLKAFRVL